VTQYFRQTRDGEDQVGSKDGSFAFVSAIFFIDNLTFKVSRNFGFLLYLIRRCFTNCRVYVISWGAEVFSKILGHFKILGAIFVISSNFHTEDTPILGANVKILFSRANWRPEFIFP
jgi:hypothetical protein